MATELEISEEELTLGSSGSGDGSSTATDERHEVKAEDIWPFRDKVTGKVVLDPDFDDYILWMRELEGKRKLLEGLNMPRTFTPRPYQVEGAVWLKEGNHQATNIFVNGTDTNTNGVAERSCKMLYDSPGLGKTLQAAMALTTPAIITCPGYLVDQWADFLEDQYPQWKVARINQQLMRVSRQNMLDDPIYDVYVVNHEMWTARLEPFKGGKEPQPYLRNGTPNPDYSYTKWREWQEAKESHQENGKRTSYHWPKVRTLVIDESHHMRNRTASQAVSCAAFADGCDYVFLLTATPQYKDVRDWWHQLRIMDPRHYTSYWNWERVFTYAKTPTIYMVLRNRAGQLQQDIAKYAIGRTYNDVGLYLPDLIEKTVKVNWHPDLYKAYREMKSSMALETDNGRRIDINPASLLHTLRLFTGCPEKVDAVKKIVEDIPGEKPIILFCWYRDAAELLADEFALLPSSVKIDGGYNQKERLRRAAALDSRVKCVTMASASEGVDWSDASTVIFFEEDYTPGKIYQALSRVRRWSKDGESNPRGKEPIVCYYVHMKASVDEAVHQAVVERNGDIRMILRRALK